MTWEAKEPSAVRLPRGAQIFSRETRREAQGGWYRALFSQNFVRYRGNSLTVHELETHRAAPDFSQAEFHSDEELFFFTEGTSSMLLMELEGECPRLETAVRILLRPGDLLAVAAGTAHFIGPSLTESASCFVVAARDARTGYVHF